MVGVLAMLVYVTPQVYSQTLSSFSTLPIVNTEEEECLRTSKLYNLCFNFKGNLLRLFVGI